MKANETTVLKFLEGQKQFHIPIYQRDYKWTKKQCEDLLFNVKEIVKKDIDSHFLGSIVYIEDSIYTTEILPKLFIIDGQQRITTLMLLLLAIGNNDKEGTLAKKIKDVYLLNQHEKDLKNKYKLILKYEEERVLNHLITDQKIRPYEKKMAVYKNYQFFYKYFSDKDADYLESFFNAMNKLLVIDVSLDKNNDNPQRIFEMLNSTGLQLKTSDMIRNFILMGFEREKQEQIYRRYWRPLENSVGIDNLDNFFRDYLMTRFQKVINRGTIYSDFKIFYALALSRAEGNEELVVKDIYRHGEYYRWITRQPATENFRRLKTSETTYPFILKLKRDLEMMLLTQKEFDESMSLVESYLFRRIVCEVSATPLKKVFSKIESAKELLSLNQGVERFPSDAEFKEYLQDDGFYSFYDSKFIKYTLVKLEEFYSGKPFEIEKFAIEYIVPNCCITPEWKKTLGSNWQEKYKKYVNGLENLTLSEIAVPKEGSFNTKNEIYKKSELSLNSYFKENEIKDFSEEELLKRREKLVVDILQVW
jgi:uncharacterized protein with ParB-like and HNH nuclease domain